MKALSIIQPWASLIAIGANKFETRGYVTNYRGPIAIHASARMNADAKYSLSTDLFATTLKPYYGLQSPLPLGCIVATARLADCLKCEWWKDSSFVHNLSVNEQRFGNFDTGRYAWLLSDVTMLSSPIPARGALGLWEWTQPEGELIDET